MTKEELLILEKILEKIDKADEMNCKKEEEYNSFCTNTREDWNDSQNIKNVVKTLKQCFKYIYVFKAQEKNEHQKRQNLIVVAVDQEVHFNIVSYHNINQKRYHQGMIDHVDDIDYTNGRILRDKNLL